MRFIYERVTATGVLPIKNIILGEYSEDYASENYASHTKKSGIMFYVPVEQHNIVQSDAKVYMQTLWIVNKRCGGFSRVTALLTNANNERHNVVLRIQKAYIIGSHCLEEIHNGSGYLGRVIVTCKAEDNYNLTEGVYNGDFIIIGGGWHHENYRVAILVNVILTVTPDEIIPGKITPDQTTVNQTDINMMSELEGITGNKEMDIRIIIGATVSAAIMTVIGVVACFVIKEIIYAPVQLEDS